MMKLTTIAASTFLMAGAAQAVTVDFEDFSAGDVIDTIDIGGVSTGISTTGGQPSNSGDVVVFDTANPGTNSDGDPDLGAPFFNAAGATLSPGNVLIIGELPSADTGVDNFPDDNGRGGQIIFDFASAVTFNAFDVFDDVTNFAVFSNLGTIIDGINLGLDNEFASFSGFLENNVGISQLTFDFGSASGAIDNLSFDVDVAPVPVPASLPLLLAGLGGLGYMGRRRRKNAA